MDFFHTFERFVIHFFCSPGIFLVVLAGFAYLARKVSWFPPLTSWWAFIVPAMVVFIFTGFREVWDVAHGGYLLKTYSDWVSWGAGLACGIWGLRRMRNDLETINQGIGK